MQPPETQNPAVDPDTGLTDAQLRAHQARVEAREAANVTPAPGPLLDAFLPEPLTVAGFTLRPAVYSDFLILRRIESPILAEMRELSKEPADRQAVTYTDVDYWELLFLWTRPIAEARAALASREAFRERALAATADTLPVSIITELPAMVTALSINFVRALSTQVGYQAPAPKDGTVFTKPPEAPTTASAGGSTQ